MGTGERTFSHDRRNNETFNDRSSTIRKLAENNKNNDNNNNTSKTSAITFISTTESIVTLNFTGGNENDENGENSENPNKTNPSNDTNVDFWTEIQNGFTLFPSQIADWIDKKLNQSLQNSDEHCDQGDLTKPYAVYLQVILGFLSFGVLILKRRCEPPESRRSGLIWFLDTSKQGFSMMTMHLINIWLSESSEKADPCTYYLTSFLLDSSIGLLIIWLGLKSVEFLITNYQILGGLPFGEYDRENYVPQDTIGVEDNPTDTENEDIESDPYINSSNSEVTKNFYQKFFSRNSHNNHHHHKTKNAMNSNNN